MPKNIRLFSSWAIIIAAAITLFLAQSSYWVNHTVFNQQNFTKITTESLLADESRNAISASVVDHALSDRPLVKQIVGSRAESLVSGLLASDLSNQLFTALTKKVYVYTTSSPRQDIAIDLSAIKMPLASIINFAENQGREIHVDPNRIPSSVVLVESNSFPDLSNVVKAMLWLGPLLWLSTLALFALYIYLGRDNYAKRVYITGFTIIGVAVMGLFMMPFIPAPIAAAIPDINIRIVAENLVTNFLAPFRTQMVYMLVTTSGVLLVFNQRFNILRLLRSTEQTLKTKVKR